MSPLPPASATRLLVLGVVRIFQPVHGYDVRRELLEWRVNEWAHVAPGSIYHQLRALNRDGLLEVTGVEQHGGRPARTSYQLTADGESGFFHLLRRALEEVEASGTLVLAALPFFPMLARDEVIHALQRRVAEVDGYLARSDPADVEHWDAPEHVTEIVELGGARLRAEAGWARELVRRLYDGRYRLAGDRERG